MSACRVAAPIAMSPSSSRMYEPLLRRLSADYHLVAPDYPGFGHSDAPDSKAFSYTFDHIAQVMEHFTEALSLDRDLLRDPHHRNGGSTRSAASASSASSIRVVT